MKQLKQSPVAKIIAWILITVSALMLLAGTAGAYAISELGFYTRSVEDIREEQFERIAGKYSARVLLNLNNTENETYFKDTNFRYGVVEASNYEELEKLDLNQQSDTCQLFGVHVLTKVNVVMPNWLQLSKLNESTQNNWNGFLSAMMEYEGRHKDIVKDAAQKIGDGIASLPVNSSCQALREQANAVGETQLEKAREQMRRYQSETGNGRYMGVAYPKF